METPQDTTNTNPTTSDPAASLASMEDQFDPIDDLEPATPASAPIVVETKTDESSISAAPQQAVPPEQRVLHGATFTELSTELIKPNPWQPRKVFREENLQELADSIKMHGVLQPLVVMPIGDGYYQLIVGERRLRASKLAGLTKVPANIRDAVEEQKKLELALIENIQRH